MINIILKTIFLTLAALAIGGIALGLMAVRESMNDRCNESGGKVLTRPGELFDSCLEG